MARGLIDPQTENPPLDGRWFSRALRLAGAGLVAASAALLISGSAGATGPTSGSTLPNAITPTTTFATGTPYASGQVVNITVPANAIFSPTLNLNIVECEAPGGAVPTDPSLCDGSTIQGPSLKPHNDGSVDLHAQTGSDYTLYALPDSFSLGETSGNTCNLTNPCVLYIGQNQGDFTQPHFWSKVFYIAPNATDDGQGAGDGSPPPPPTLPDAGTSTVTAGPATPTADGGDLETITVTLLSTSSVPVAGRTVTLSQGAGHSVITATATPNVTDANGVATFTATDTTAETVTYAAKDTTDNLTVTQAPAVQFVAPAVATGHSTVIASPTAVPADGTTTATVTVTLRDQATTPRPVAGKTVTLQGTGGSVITPAASPDVTNAQGVATFTVTDPSPETVTYSATDVSDNNLALTATTEVTFGTLSVSAATSTVTAAPNPAPVAGAGSTITVKLSTSNHSVVPGKTVTLAASSATVTISPSANPDVTDASGQATFVARDSVAEAVTFNATDVTDGNLAITQTASVTYQAAAPSATVSTITPATTTIPADGQTQAPITVTIEDQFGQAVSGKSVQLHASPTGAVQFRPIAAGGTGTPGVTNASGIALFEADDTAAETVTFTASDTSDGFAVAGSVSVTFTAGTADANQSTVTSSPTSVPSDGATASTVTVTMNDHFGNHISGKVIGLSATNGTSVITAVNNTTNAAGAAIFTVTDTAAEVVGYTATDTTDSNLPLTAQAVVTFGNPPAPPPVAADCSVAANQASVPADGSSSAVITVSLYDANGDPVDGKTVALNAATGSSAVTAMTGAAAVRSPDVAVTGATGSGGQVQFTVSDPTAETVTYTAVDTSDNVALTGQTVTISFTAVPATTTTTTTTTTAPSATTTTTTTTTTTGVAGATGSATGTSGGSPAGDSGSAGTGSGASLAFTGSPSALPWLLGLGGLFLLVGSFGRRRVVRDSR